MSVTFQVDDVKLATQPLHEVEVKEVINTKTKGEGEAEACSTGKLITLGDTHSGFLQAVHVAFDSHRPLSLSPDSFWLTIAGGLATHINLNAEELRHKFVDHEGKKRIVVRRDEFVKGNPNNDWKGCFDEFSDKLETYIGKKRNLIVSDFSTTGPVEKAASEVVLMDAMQSYFEYCVRTLCGFPKITLEGTVEDWKSIRYRVSCLSEFGLDWWTDKLIPVLDKVVATAGEDVDVGFWKSFLKLSGGSGGPFVNGWINTLFPYLKRDEKNRGLDWENNQRWGGPTPDDFPSGLSSVPFEWEYFFEKFDMQFIGGIVGVSQASDLTLRPEAGWAIKEK